METLTCKDELVRAIVEVRMMNGQFEGQVRRLNLSFPALFAYWTISKQQWIPGKIVKQNQEHGIYDVLISEDLPEHLSDYVGILVPNVPIECVRPHRTCGV